MPTLTSTAAAMSASPDATVDSQTAVHVFAPATIGNLACGFDVLGMALEGPGDVVTAWPTSEPGVRIEVIHGDGGRIPREPDRNAAAIAAAAVLSLATDPDRAPGTPPGLALILHKGLPLASGLGGSAASAVAGAVAADRALGLGLPAGTLLRCAGEGEARGAGATHLDNVAPCLLGGICLVLGGFHATMSGDPAVVELPIPPELTAVVVHPHVEIRTEDARRALGDRIPLEAGIAQWGNTAGFVAALYREDMELLGRTLVDHVAEPRRAHLVPGFQAVKAAAMEAGALGASLSGSGPSVFALCHGFEVARTVGAAMVEAFRRAGGVDSDLHISPVGLRGARVIPAPPSPLRETPPRRTQPQGEG
ncbi:MAG: homoserine kinase [Gemmatimonadales bacterium]|nr:MAG: homoserine kinase [Gemmatimonadales bacterium]